MRPAALALLLAAAPAALASDPDDLRDRLDRQERRIQELEGRLAAIEGRAPSAPPAPADLDAALRRYLDSRPVDEAAIRVERPANPRFRAGGYMTLAYRSPDGPSLNPSFESVRVVPQFSFDISRGIEFAMELEFGHGGAADFLADGEAVVEYAEARFQVDEAFVPKAGVLLLPFLRYNQNHDDPLWNIADRPFTATRVFHAAFAQPGVGAEGVIPLGGGNSFNYDIALGNGPDDEVTNLGFEDAETPFLEDNNNDKALWLRAGIAPRLPFLDAADLGVSFARARLDPAGDVRMAAFGFDGKVVKDRFDLIFEWAGFDYDRPSAQPVASFPRGQSGGFVELDTHLLRGLPPLANGLVGEGSDLVLALRHDGANLNDRRTGASVADDARALTLGLALRFTPKTVVRLDRRTERNALGTRDLGAWTFSLSTYF